ncbi:MAG: hypothetical protein ACI9NY_000647 [Kiritimatiellia bacterium]|jgi:hypothetical protein
MSTISYKKMAGTSAVFISAEFNHASPVERDGMIWTAEELHLEDLPQRRQEKPAMANALALEGLEDYDQPGNGDVRYVNSIGVSFVYFERVHAWVQIVEL